MKDRLDPRVMVVLGESETALAVMSALRNGFTGQIINIVSGSANQYQNTDVFFRKVGEISKYETYQIQDDFFERANIDIIKGTVTNINYNKKYIELLNESKPIPFDKCVLACGSKKKKLNINLTNFLTQVIKTISRERNKVLVNYFVKTRVYLLLVKL